MSSALRKRMSIMAVMASTAAVTAVPGSAEAADSVVFPAGQVCTFKVQVDIVGGDHRVELTSPRSISAGRGTQLTFTNLSTGAKLTLPATGSVTQNVVDPITNVTTTTLTGANVVLLFPTDITAGPSTTLYIGRVVFTSDAEGRFTVLSSTGRSTDICAALS